MRNCFWYYINGIRGILFFGCVYKNIGVNGFLNNEFLDNILRDMKGVLVIGLVYSWKKLEIGKGYN